MLSRYQPKTSADSIRALREIIQEIALVGLWRAKFFEHAAFYGGTALRILYGLDRFSEDLDFSLLAPSDTFSLAPYNKAISEELNSFGFNVTVSTKLKNVESNIESGFIKANTQLELMNIGFKAFTVSGIPKDAKVKIKIEVDVKPPIGFNTEAKTLMEPIPVAIKVYVPSDLFAGKMHALLCRLWKERVKGRDWYDFVWFIRKKIPLNLKHLELRMLKSGHLQQDETLTEKLFLEMLKSKINSLNIDNALIDIRPYITDPSLLNSWSKEYFKEFAGRIIFSK